MNITGHDIRWVLITVLVLIISVALHEFGHAIMATWLGDDTPRRQGRVTLNPIAHADPIGTVLLPIVAGLYNAHALATGARPMGGLGWGKPVQWNPSRIHRKWRMSTAQILVAVAGPAMNVVLALVVAIVHCILMKAHVLAYDSDINAILFYAVGTNFVLFFFNLVPAPPLDGGHVAEGLMPYKHRSKFESYARYGVFIVGAIIFIPVLSRIFQIPAQFCTEHVYKALFALLGVS